MKRIGCKWIQDNPGMLVQTGFFNDEKIYIWIIWTKIITFKMRITMDNRQLIRFVAQCAFFVLLQRSVPFDGISLMSCWRPMLTHEFNPQFMNGVVPSLIAIHHYFGGKSQNIWKLYKGYHDQSFSWAEFTPRPVSFFQCNWVGFRGFLPTTASANNIRRGGQTQDGRFCWTDIGANQQHVWLVVYLPLWNICSSVGVTIPNIWTNKKCSKPPARCHANITVVWTMIKTVKEQRT